jgi:transcriptional regulator with XRE-family HTH domain
MRSRLVEELGVEPGESLRQTHMRIISGEVRPSPVQPLAIAPIRPARSRAGRPEKALNPSANPIALFAQQLRALRHEAGSPTFRDLASSTGLASTTLSKAVAGDRLPTLATTLALVHAIGGDGDVWRQRWEQVAGALKQAKSVPPQITGEGHFHQERWLRPGPASTPAEFVEQMRLLRAWAGNPSLRQLGRRSGVPASTLYDVLRRDRLPRRALLRAFLLACEVPEDGQREWEAAWVTLAAGLAPPSPLVNPE